MPTHRLPPLELGHGRTVLEVFLEPTCPYSVRTFNKLDAFLAEAGEDRVTLKLRLHSQPWHLFSGVVVRCVSTRKRAWASTCRSRLASIRRLTMPSAEGRLAISFCGVSR